MTPAVHIIVKGMVQGVGFRYFVARRAEQLRIKGFVRNLYNGDVEIVAKGERGPLEELIKEINVGPRSAHVAKCLVDWKETDEQFNGFEIR